MDEHAPQTPRRSEAEARPAKTPHLHVRIVEGMLGDAVVSGRWGRKEGRVRVAQQRSGRQVMVMPLSEPWRTAHRQ